MLNDYPSMLLSVDRPSQPTPPPDRRTSVATSESFSFEHLRFTPDWNEIELEFDESAFANIPLRVELFDKFGRRAKYWEIPSAPRSEKRKGNITLDISNVPDGSYDLCLTHGGNSMVRAVVIRRR